MNPYARRAEPGSSWWYLGCLVTSLADAAGTGGAVSVVEAVLPEGLAVPPHRHTHEAEAFYVVRGRMRFTVDGETLEAPAGQFVWLPQGATHGFEVLEAGTTALIMCTPAGHLEAMFAPFSEPARTLDLPAPPPDVPWEAMLALDTALGVEYA